MKTTKEERILNMAKGFMNIYKVHKDDKKDLPQIFEIIMINNPYLINSKLSVPERTLIGEEVKKFLETKYQRTISSN